MNNSFHAIIIAKLTTFIKQFTVAISRHRLHVAHHKAVHRISHRWTDYTSRSTRKYERFPQAFFERSLDLPPYGDAIPQSIDVARQYSELRNRTASYPMT
jgi:hypothetical protein